MVRIQESGMTFGPFEENQVYQIEKSEAYTGLGEGVKVVEFIYRPGKDKIFFVEAKKSSPMPKNKNEFERFIGDIVQKFTHSFNLWLTLNLNRRKDVISDDILDVSTERQIFRFVLVINGHEKAWLPPIKAAIERKMLVEIKIWGHVIIVINEKQAAERRLINMN